MEEDKKRETSAPPLITTTASAPPAVDDYGWERIATMGVTALPLDEPGERITGDEDEEMGDEDDALGRIMSLVRLQSMSHGELLGMRADVSSAEIEMATPHLEEVKEEEEVAAKEKESNAKEGDTDGEEEDGEEKEEEDVEDVEEVEEEEEDDSVLQKDEEERLQCELDKLVDVKSPELIGPVGAPVVSAKTPLSEALMYHTAARPDKWLFLLLDPPVKVWNAWMLVVLTYVLVYMPFRVAFEDPQRSWVDWVVDLSFMCDIAVVFNSAYENERGDLITDRRRIAKHYVKGWLLVDLLAALPLDLIISSASGRIKNAAKLTRIYRLTRIPKLVQLRYLKKLVRQVVAGISNVHGGSIDRSFGTRLQPRIFRMMELGAGIVVFIHLVACLWFYIAVLEDDSESSWYSRVWSDGYPVHSDSHLRQYLISVYAVVTILTTVGFGDISPRTTIELLFVIFLMSCGVLWFSTITATIASIIASSDRKKAVHQAKLAGLYSYLNQRSDYVSPQLQALVLRHMTFLWKRELNPHVVPGFVDEIPSLLRYRVAYNMLQEIVDSSPLLSEEKLKRPLIIGLSDHLTPMRVPAGDVIAPRGFEIDKVYFLERGQVHAITSLYQLEAAIICSYSTGACIGEEGLNCVHSWPGFLRAFTDCILWSIPMDTYKQLLAANGSFVKACALAKLRWGAMQQRLTRVQEQVEIRKERIRQEQLLHQQQQEQQQQQQPEQPEQQQSQSSITEFLNRFHIVNRKSSATQGGAGADDTRDLVVNNKFLSNLISSFDEEEEAFFTRERARLVLKEAEKRRKQEQQQKKKKKEKHHTTPVARTTSSIDLNNNPSEKKKAEEEKKQESTGIEERLSRIEVMLEQLIISK